MRWSDLWRGGLGPVAAALLAGCSTEANINADVGAPEPDAALPVDTVTRDAGPAPRAADGPPAARLALSVAELDLGTVNLGSQATSAVVVSNTGDLATAPLAASVTAGADFQATNNCTGRRLGIGETCVVTLQFAPTSVGPKTATGQVSQTGGTPLAFNARGTGRLAPDAGAQDARPDVPPEARPADAAPGDAQRPDAAADQRSQ